MPVTVKKSGPGFASLEKRLAELKKADVLIGIPADHTLREGEPINNASLFYLMEHGSDINHIPPRPVLAPSIEKNKALISPHLGAAAQGILQRNPQRAENELNRAGIIASNGAKRFISDPANGLTPNAPSTIARKGSDVPLIDTGILRRNITHVVRINGRSTEGAPSDTEE